MYDSDVLCIARADYNGKSEYLYLPCEEKAIDKALARLGAAPENAKITLEDFSVNNPKWFERFKQIAADEGVYELNGLANAINSADTDLKKLWLVAEYAEVEKAGQLARGTLFFELSRILAAKHPAYFVFENVPPIRTICEGRVFTAILSELSRLGYLCEWQCIDGAAYLPQTRRRVFLVGYLDPRCAGEILPIERKGGKALSELTDHQPQGKRVYDAGGAAITQTASCGGFGGRTGLYLVDYNENSKFTDTARCITARQDSGMSHHKGEHSAVFFEYDGVYPVINPDRETVRQNGPRFRPNGAPSYCLTVVDRHGIFHRGWIRKLHPQECFRLMGFSDAQFYKLRNELGLSDSKLYKLAGNSIMVPVLVDILSRLKAVNEKYQIIKE